LKAGESEHDIDTREPLRLQGISATEPETHVLLAMQKVEGSNPFSRFEEGPHLQVFLVSAVG
jgi:hypothetical protein